MADLPITSEEGATPVVINDPVTTANVAGVNSSSALKTDRTTIAGSAVATAAAGIQKVGLTDGSGNSLTSTTIGSAQTLDVGMPDRTVAVSLTAIAQTVQISMVGKGSVAFVLTSMGTGGQVICEGSIDGSTWQGLDTWQESQESWVDNGTTITTADQYWVEPIGALWFVRLRVTAITSGTITGLLYASSATMGTYEFQGSTGTNFPNNLLYIGGKTNDATAQFQPIPEGPAGRSLIVEGITGGIPVVSTLGNTTGKTNVLKTGSLVTTAVTADQVVLTYTVTSGKTFFVGYLTLSGRQTTPAGGTATVLGTISLETPSGTKTISQSFVGGGSVSTDMLVIPFAEPIPVASAVVIRVVVTPNSTTSMTWFANFGGYER